MRSFNLTGVGEPERLDGRRVSANMFDLLGVQAILGRTFVAEEDQPGTRVVLLNEMLWKRRFGGDPSVIGRALMLNGESYTVIGVLPRRSCVCRLSGTGTIRSGCRSPFRRRKPPAAAIISSRSSRG